MVRIKFLDILGFLVLLAILVPSAAYSADYTPKDYVWTTQSKNSSESMPCGGHDIGMNVWVEKGDVLFYVSQSGWFDENNTLLKAGRWRIHFDNLPADAAFKQRLCLDDGAIYITLPKQNVSKPVISGLCPMEPSLLQIPSRRRKTFCTSFTRTVKRRFSTIP